LVWLGLGGSQSIFVWLDLGVSESTMKESSLLLESVYLLNKLEDKWYYHGFVVLGSQVRVVMKGSGLLLVFTFSAKVKTNKKFELIWCLLLNLYAWAKKLYLNYCLSFISTDTAYVPSASDKNIFSENLVIVTNYNQWTGFHS